MLPSVKNKKLRLNSISKKIQIPEKNLGLRRYWPGTGCILLDVYLIYLVCGKVYILHKYSISTGLRACSNLKGKVILIDTDNCD